MNEIKFNLPILVSQWHVTYKPLPLLGKKKLRHMLATDLIQKETSFLTDDYEAYREKKYSYTMPVEMIYDIEKNGYDLLRHHYMYKKKSWSYPEIERVDQYYIYLPYRIAEENGGYVLHEEVSGMRRKLKKNDEIYKMIIRG
ncbi:hypothetical protein [Salinicoccus roseus]|uniref:Uncharacterized protein n=1 Tax=Salinicoccus roseus TaxID=45670 RepID=A0A265E7W9_9STAP|nr:hypothetical protein [Salinicoccus roseus]OZT77536.1 hypothetical protein CFN03_06250 [Salinicoccus roseus]